MLHRPAAHPLLHENVRRLRRGMDREGGSEGNRRPRDDPAPKMFSLTEFPYAPKESFCRQKQFPHLHLSSRSLLFCSFNLVIFYYKACSTSNWSKRKRRRGGYQPVLRRICVEPAQPRDRLRIEPPHDGIAEVCRELCVREPSIRKNLADRSVPHTIPAIERALDPRMNHAELRRMHRRKGARRRPDAEHHAVPREELPLVREVIDTAARRRTVIELERIVPDEQGCRRPVRHGICRRECAHLIIGRGTVRTAQNDFEQRMG